MKVTRAAQKMGFAKKKKKKKQFASFSLDLFSKACKYQAPVVQRPDNFIRCMDKTLSFLVS